MRTVRLTTRYLPFVERGTRSSEDSWRHTDMSVVVLTVLAFQANGFDECYMSLRDIAAACGFGVTKYKDEPIQKVRDALLVLASEEAQKDLTSISFDAIPEKQTEKFTIHVSYDTNKPSGAYTQITGQEFKKIIDLPEWRSTKKSGIAYLLFLHLKSRMIKYSTDEVSGYGCWQGSRFTTSALGIGATTCSKLIQVLVNAGLLFYKAGLGNNDSVFALQEDERVFELIFNKMNANLSSNAGKRHYRKETACR